jgi:hypothetical protein
VVGEMKLTTTDWKEFIEFLCFMFKVVSGFGLVIIITGGLLVGMEDGNYVSFLGSFYLGFVGILFLFQKGREKK